MPSLASSSVVLDHHRQAVEYHLIKLVMHQETSLEKPFEAIEPMQLPPFINRHFAASVHADLESRTQLMPVLVEGSAVPRTACRLLDGMEDVREGQM